MQVGSCYSPIQLVKAGKGLVRKNALLTAMDIRLYMIGSFLADFRNLTTRAGKRVGRCRTLAHNGNKRRYFGELSQKIFPASSESW